MDLKKQVDNDINLVETKKFAFLHFFLFSDTLNLSEIPPILKRKVIQVITTILSLEETEILLARIRRIIQVINRQISVIEDLPPGKRVNRFGGLLAGVVPAGMVVMELVKAGIDMTAIFLRPVFTILGTLGVPNEERGLSLMRMVSEMQIVYESSIIVINPE